jgi:hypothetical protein
MEMFYIADEFEAFDNLYFLVGRKITLKDKWCGEIKGILNYPFDKETYTFKIGRRNCRKLRFENLERVITN